MRVEIDLLDGFAVRVDGRAVPAEEWRRRQAAALVKLLALADYQAQRDRMALPMQPIVDRLASHEWDLAEARRLLRGLSSVMADEVEAIRGFDLAPTRTA